MPGSRDDAPLVRRLTDDDRGRLHALLERHPYSACVLAARLDVVGSLEPTRLGGVVVAAFAPAGGLRSACFVGGSVVPVGDNLADARAIGAVVGRERTTASEIVGDARFVPALWRALAATWPPARSERWSQPLLVLDRPAGHRVDAELRPATLADLDLYVPAAAAMFEEELGVSPFVMGGEAAYRARLAAVVRAGRAFVRTDDRGRVVFKAEIGAVSRRTAQIQGVWVAPTMRGQGIGAAAMAGVVAAGLRVAPAVSLYVNDYNTAARALYAKLAFAQVATLATVLF